MRHWWREFTTDTYRAHRASWEARREAECCGYATEEDEWGAINRGPTFKRTLVSLRGTRCDTM